MICGHTTAEPVVSYVPLSCVPPCRCFGLSPATEKLWNCSVDNPLFRLNRCFGTRESNCLHAVICEPESPRSSHWYETSLKSPLDRTMPPSDPEKNMYGLSGCVTSAW